MIVQCPSCTSRYRIRDANIPPSGGKIRCPSCSHSFIVYPEAEEEDEQKTSITGRNELEKLAGGMFNNAAADEGGATEIVQGDALDKMRAIEALKQEMGGALDGDGTVEMQNPLDMWKAAQAAVKEASAQQPAAPPEPQYGDPSVELDEYDTAKTEIVSPDALDFSSFPGQSDAGSSDEAQAEPAKPSLPKPSIPRPSMPKAPGAQSPSAPWQDPDRTIDAGLDGGTNGIETASVAPPTNIPEMVDAPSGPPGPPPRPPAQPPASAAPQQPAPAPQQPAPEASSGLTADQLFGDVADVDVDGPVHATQEDSGPSPTTDPFSMPDSDPFANAGGNSDQETLEAPSVPVGGQSQEAFAQGAPDEPAGGPDPRHQGPWKLKTNFGLTYEFPDNKSLRSWMSSREELDGHTLSADGNHFYELNEFPQLTRSPSMVSQQIPSYSADQRPPSGGYAAQNPPAETVQAQAPAPSGAAGFNAPGGDSSQPGQMASHGPSGSGTFTSPANFGSGQHNAMGGDQPGLGNAPAAPSFGAPADRSASTVQNEYIPPSQNSAWDKVLWLVLLVLMLAAGVIALQTFKVVDIVGEARKVLGMPAKVDPPVQPGIDSPTENLAIAAPEVDAAEVKEEQAEMAQKLLKDARREVEKNRLPAALQKLETVAEIDASNVEIYEIRADIFDQLGQADKAEQARAKVEELQAPAGEDDSDAGTPDAS